MRDAAHHVVNALARHEAADLQDDELVGTDTELPAQPRRTRAELARIEAARHDVDAPGIRAVERHEVVAVLRAFGDDAVGDVREQRLDRFALAREGVGAALMAASTLPSAWKVMTNGMSRRRRTCIAARPDMKKFACTRS
jgi:hypothetical protein